LSSYLTITEPLRIEIEKIKGSRFIADAIPVTSASEIATGLAAIRDEFADASHHCYAWRLLGDQHRSSDDGEPAGSAGKPILNHLLGSELQQTLIVVTRYFGGTKLGSGGLIRAYGAAAKAALEGVERIEKIERTSFSLRFGYGMTAAVQSVLTRFEAEESASHYGEVVELSVLIVKERGAAFAAELSEATAGQVRAVPDQGDSAQ